MSGKIMGKVWDLELPHNQLLVLLALADHADHEGNNVFPSLGLVAWKTGYSEQQVRRVMRDLEDANILKATDKSPGKAAHYCIDVSQGKQKLPRVITPYKMSGVSKSKGLHSGGGDPLHPDSPTPDMPSAKNGHEPSLEPSLEPSSSDLIALYIKAWLDGLTIPPATNQYSNKTNRANAKAIQEAGFTTDQVTAFTHATAILPYWSGKLVTLKYIGDNIAAWSSVKPPPTHVNPAHVPFVIEAITDAVDMPQEAKDALNKLKQKMLVSDEAIYGKRPVTNAA